jgi:hypothetical protein
MYPLKKPNIKPKLLSIDPTPVQITALPKVFPISIVEKRVKINIATPNPMLFTKSDLIYSLTIGCNLGTRIMVITVDRTHFINEIKLKEKPFKKHCTTQ